MPMWFKRFIVCSATVAGGYIYYWFKNKSIAYDKESHKFESEESSSYIYLPENAGIDFDESIESSWVFWKKNNSPIYWKLLMLCKSKDRKVRLQAVESLAEMSSLDKWQYTMIAQACDARTSIGLARMFKASQHFFLSPYFDLMEGNLQSELLSFLSSLPSSDFDPCVQNLVKQVMKSAKIPLKNEYTLDLEIGDPFVIYHSQQKKKEIFLLHKLCLQTFLGYSAIKFHRTSMIEKGILKLLLKIYRYHQNDFEIHSLIAQILANFAMQEEFTNVMYMSGWIGILARWAKSSNITVSLPASKALANLDNDDISHSLYDDGIYLLHPAFRQSHREISADVVFVHGLLGATFWTWRQCDTQRKSNKTMPFSETKGSFQTLSSESSNYTMCWPKDWLAVDIPTLRIISVDYKTCISNWSSYCPPYHENNSIQRRARDILNKLLLSNVGERPIIWIAHSMGGLIVKQILCESFESKDKMTQSLAQKTVGMVFYSVPHKGSDLVNKINSASRIFQLSSDIAQLQKGSSSLLSLNEKFRNIVIKYNIHILSFGETKKSRWGISSSVLVPLDSADPGFGEFYTLPVDHLSTCKPVSSDSAEYLKVLNFLLINIPKVTSHEKYFKVFEISKVLCLIP